MVKPARAKLRGNQNIFPKERILETKAAVRRFHAHLEESGIGLWDHQNRAMVALGRFLTRSERSISEGGIASGAIVMPTGAGKTAVAAEITKALKVRSLILAPTIKIVQQHLEELAQRVPTLDAAIYKSKRGLDSEVVVMTYHAAVSLLKEGALPDDFGVAFYDEAHRSISHERKRLHGKLSQIEIGLTATPEYDELRHIWNVFGERIFEMELEEAVNSEVLSPLRGYVVSTMADLRSVELRRGEDQLDEREAEKHLNVLARNTSARDFYVNNFMGTATVVFCVSIKHAEGFAEYLRKAGVRAACIHGRMEVEKRDKVLEDFEAGKIDVITSRDILIEGWDSKRVVLAMNLRPTYSRVVKAHMVGRVMRTRPGKEAGIFVEFQDIYTPAQQPILVHHLMDRVNFRQGGLIAAPPAKRAIEERKLSKKKKVKVSGNINVDFKVRPVVRLMQREKPYDLTNPDLLEEILESRPDIDWENTATSKLRAVLLDHQAFTGTVNTLMHKSFGIPTHRNSKLRSVEDVQGFLSFALQKRRALKEMELGADVHHFTGGRPSGIFVEPDEAFERKELHGRFDVMLGTLTERQEDVLRKMFGIHDAEKMEKYSLFFGDMEREEVASVCGISNTRVHQIEASALRKMRYLAKKKKFFEFFRKAPREAFNPDHSHRFGIVTHGYYVVSLIKIPEWENTRSGQMKLTEGQIRIIEANLNTLFNSLENAKTREEAIKILRNSGLAGRRIMKSYRRSRYVSREKMQLFKNISDFFKKEIGRQVSWEFIPEGTFLEL